MRRAIIMLLGALLMTQPANAEIARVKRAMGIATVERGGASLPAKPGLQLLSGDILLTGKNGQMGLTFSDNTRFSIGPNSRVAVDKFDYDARARTGEFVASVNRGAIAVVSGQIARSKQDAMKVRTPTSLLGVRGTRFIVEVPK